MREIELAGCLDASSFIHGFRTKVSLVVTWNLKIIHFLPSFLRIRDVRIVYSCNSPSSMSTSTSVACRLGVVGLSIRAVDESLGSDLSS